MHYNALENIPHGLYLIAQTVRYLGFMNNVIRSIAPMEGIAFTKLHLLYLRHNDITHLIPGDLITPQLRLLDLGHNHLVSLGDVTQYSWGNSLPDGVFLSIYLNGNPWNCDRSLTWLQSNLYILVRNVLGKKELVYAKPPLKPCIRKVSHPICHSPDITLGTAVVPRRQIVDHRRITSLKKLVGK